MFGTFSVPCFITIGLDNLQVWHIFIMLLFLQFAVSFAFMHKMISFPFLRCELMNICSLHGGVCHWFVSSIVLLGNLLLLADFRLRSGLFDVLIANFVYSDNSDLSILSTSYCCPWPSPHSSGIFTVFCYFWFQCRVYDCMSFVWCVWWWPWYCWFGIICCCSV